MIRRARISMEVAVIVAIFAFSGILHITAPAAKLVFCALLGFSVLSVLFSLFEEGPPHGTQTAKNAAVPLPLSKEAAAADPTSI